MPQPNIIFILSDQQRWDSVGCYGQSLPITPNLDRMAANGVLFERALSAQPLCGPMRACFQTGKYATETGCWMNNIALPLDERTIAHWLIEAGYEVGYIGKWHLASTGERYARPENRPGQREAFDCKTHPVPPERRGGYKDYWLAADVLELTSEGYAGCMFDADGRRVDFPEGRYRVDAVTDLILDYLRTRDRKKPFFLFASYIEPHWQNKRKRHDAPRGREELFRSYCEPGDLVGTADEVGWLADGWRREYARYLACVNSLDENVGRIRQELKRLALAADTVVIYTSDHGCHFGQRNPGAKDTCHDASIRVPLIACGPGFGGGKAIDELVSLIDLPPTILSAAAAPLPGTTRGRPLQPLVAGDAAGWPDDVFFQTSPRTIGRGVRTKRWKFSVMVPGGDGRQAPAGSLYVPDFLYDLQNDPHERTNLVHDPAYADVRAELAERLRRRMQPVEDNDFEIRP
ncbi:MAG: sulfatase-like hydrolase/transferase [Planctomycetota bacterium]|jgi:uncharacterized sulfatase